MRRIFQRHVPFLALAATACATLSPDELAAVRRVQVRTVSPDHRCQNLGAVTGSSTSEGPSGMRAKAVRMGGNTLMLNEGGDAAVLYCPDLAVKTPDSDP